MRPIKSLFNPLVNAIPNPVAPKFFQRARNGAKRHFGQLKRLRVAVGAQCLKRPDEIEALASELNLPLASSDRVYILRGHIEYVRQRMGNAAPPG